MTIHKYILHIGDNDLKLPMRSQILTAQIQGKEICLWALVDPQKCVETRSFRVIGTGWEYAPEHLINLKYINTVQTDRFVWHVFEEIVS